MEVVEERVTVLSNFEVFETIKQTAKDENDKQKNDRCKTLSTVLYETTKYLKNTPAASQTEECVVQLIDKLKPYKLTGAEMLQIVNLRPNSATDIQLLVEETEERFPDEEQLDKLVETITECLPPPPPPKK